MITVSAKHRFIPLVFILVFILLIQACGNSNPSSGSSGSTPSASANPKETATAAPGSASPTAAGTAPATSKPPTALRVGYVGNNKLNVPSGAEGWGFSKGIITEELKKLGITDISFVGFTGGSDLNEALIAGRLDVGIYGDTPAITARSKGAKTKLIGQPSNSILIYLIGKKNGVKSVAELKGKKVATQKGSVLHRYTAGILQKEGALDPANLLQLNSTDVESALARGDIEAGSLNGGLALGVIAKGYPLLDKSSNNPSLSGSLVTVATEDYLAKFPGFPKVWNELRAKSLADLKSKQDAYYELLSQINGFPVDIVKQTDAIENIATNPYTDASLKQLEDVKTFLLEQKLIDKDFVLGDWIAK
ncbi:MAG: ABC transporter substrate-binding protein [Paenibacillaceae bacterium]|nr:ABC transporter substrate-binding protein [Paenibacillaceae bacterium]